MPRDVLAEVVSNTRLTADYQVLVLRAPELAAEARAGQFVMVKAEGGLDPLLRRPFSVFQAVRDADGRTLGLSLLSKRVGPSTERLFLARPGDRITCLGPLGRPFTLVDPPTEAWMVAGGVGLAPFAMLVEALAGRGVATSLFFGGRRSSDLFCLDLFERHGTRTILATEDGTRGYRGKVTGPLAAALAAAPADRPLMLYACGPEAMLAAVAALAAAHGRPSEVAMERIMGCGLGGCYSCVVRARDPHGRVHYVRSCLEGPVFRGEDVVWE
jgi:dihydroorotate dehydrogenase electron transfer subunit